MTPAQILRLPGRLAIATLVLLIRLYQITIAPLLTLVFGPLCRFEPSCSRYMIGALRKYGLIRGTLKGLGRILRCHPGNPGGYDPP